MIQQPETICAIATATGGAIGIVRVSGPQAISTVEKIFTPKGANAQPLHEQNAYTIAYGNIHDRQDRVVDEVLVSLFRAPHSYTGEDSVEISCHGSRYILSQVLQLLIDNGCRQAEPGEYTRRAYLNGKMDLSQAEAVADLIASTNQATHRMAMSQLRGHFSSELARLREQLLKLTSLLELELDFSDHEELEFADRTELQTLANQIDHRITTLSHSFEAGNALKHGIPVAIVGKTNVGKSTLLNRLVGDERAIVSDIHGTTRDVIEDCVEIQGIIFRFIDTAGLRHTDDIVETIGIERTYQKLHEAAIVLWVVDQEPTQEETEEMQQKAKGKKLIVVRNKADLSNASEFSEPSEFSEFSEATIAISAKTGLGFATLEHALVHAADLPTLTENDVIVTSARHYEALSRAHTNLQRVLDGMALNLSGDLLAEDLRLVLHDLAEITGGEIVTNEVLGNIFKHFCVGK